MIVGCAQCGASWDDSNGADCWWCSQRAIHQQSAAIQRLLFPEWLSWGERYFQLDDGYRQVWRRTRGVYGDFTGAWQRAIFDAVADGTITDHQAAQALERYQRWMIHTAKSDD